MTERERFLAALRCEPVDRMPLTVVVDGFNCPLGLPERLLDPLDMVAACRYLGCAVHDRLGPSPIAKTAREVRSRVEVLENGDQVHEHATPAGTLRARYAPSREAGTAFLVGHCVHGPADYEALMALAEDAVIAPSPEGIAAATARLQEIGDDGVMYTCGPSTPIMDLTRTWVGLERFLEDLADHQAIVERTLDVMARRNCEEFEALAAHTPARLLVFWDDVTSAYLSPALFRRYVLPVYRAYADICHAHGKLLVAHACGHLRAFLPMLAETGVDAIDWVTPPPCGDTVWSEAQTVFAGRVAVMGAPTPSVLRFGTVDDVAAHMREVLHGVDTRRGFVLMIPPPQGTPAANLVAARAAADPTPTQLPRE